MAEANVLLRRRSSHRRQSSVAISWNRFEDPSDRRRDSNASWIRDADDDEVSGRTGRSRPNSWGPVGEFYYRESLCLSETDKSLFSHHECNNGLILAQPIETDYAKRCVFLKRVSLYVFVKFQFQSGIMSFKFILGELPKNFKSIQYNF